MPAPAFAAVIAATNTKRAVTTKSRDCLIIVLFPFLQSARCGQNGRRLRDLPLGATWRKAERPQTERQARGPRDPTGRTVLDGAYGAAAAAAGLEGHRRRSRSASSFGLTIRSRPAAAHVDGSGAHVDGMVAHRAWRDRRSARCGPVRPA